MVVANWSNAFRIVPSMAPTTRSARISIEAQTLSSKGVSCSRAITADIPICKAEGFQEGSNLRTFKAKTHEKPDGVPRQKVSNRVRKKKLSSVDPEEPMATDLEDLCSLGDSQGDNVFLRREVLAIRTALLSWYDRNHRELPWRVNTYSCLTSPFSADEPEKRDGRCKEASTSRQVKKEASHPGVSGVDPIETAGERAYAVWVSEMMLQQTRVATVISYYERWMSTWPTVHALAQATQEEVNTLWAGLGYYRRARFLLEGAKYIVQDLGGRFPGTVEELQKVPGIGSYTAGAIASIAFKQAVPVVDGNVIRVLCRLRAISSNPKTSTTVKRLWALASQLVDEGRPGDLNQALMELGATLCSPTSPSCASCPIASHCTALKLVHSGDRKVTSVTCFPTKVPKAAPRQEYVAVCIVERESKSKMTASSLLLVQRPLKGLLAGLWEFPSAPLDNPESSERARSTAVDNYLQETVGIELGKGGFSVTKREECGTYVHVFSHIRLHMFVQWVLVSEEEGDGRSIPRGRSSVVTKWVSVDSIDSLGLTSGVKKVYKMFTAVREKQLIVTTSTKRQRTNHQTQPLNDGQRDMSSINKVG